MTYQVTLLPRAKLQLYDSALWWAEHRSTEQASRWLDGFEAALQLLADNPERWPLAPEVDAVPFEIHEMTYGLGRRRTHRAVFEIREQKVIVYAIRHLAQDALTPDDFQSRAN